MTDKQRLREMSDARQNENQITYAACIDMVVFVCKKVGNSGR